MVAAPPSARAVPGAFAKWHVETAAFAANPANSRGRFHTEGESESRSPFERDRDRVIHARAFRHLKGKTQVFVAHEGDYFRTRLTHSLEVAQIARSVARRLGLDADLAETCALAHDLGHPPFGHTGEDVLQSCMEAFEGFDHNAQTLRVLTKLEHSYPGFDGLNLTFETLEGVVKHNGPLLGPGRTVADLPAALRDYEGLEGLALDLWPSAEAQVAALADDIAYNNHDIDDGLQAELFTLDSLRAASPLVDGAAQSVFQDFPGLDQTRLRKEMVRRLIGIWVGDLIETTRLEIARSKPKSVEDVRALGGALVRFSDEMTQEAARLRRFLMTNMYRHWKVNRRRNMAKRVVRELFDTFIGAPQLLPGLWQSAIDGAAGLKTARTICDYIAGMTDDFAIEEHRRLFSFDRS
ncbi:MAG: deoxyguanosinetriphosphate triphosphohydrolase [Caulobacterales bacterium]